MKQGMVHNTNKMMLNNKSAALTVNLFGGAITDFHLKNNNINPLSFAFSREQMPENNRLGAPYRGHFLCLGRWGPPSEAERAAGMPDHGQMANMAWRGHVRKSRHNLFMEADSPLEGLSISRKITMDDSAPVYCVDEEIINTQHLGRLYNMVQHPTLAAPFLDNNTVVHCNGNIGFDQFRYDQQENNYLQWPYANDDNDIQFDLRRPDKAYNSVFSFIVEGGAEYGWITAFNPQHQLLLGYAWRRSDYPWIHLWQHWEEGQIKYRGIEFGTAGIHKPFKGILKTGIKLFNENTVEYIDAGEVISRRYLSFLYHTKNYTGDVKRVDVLTDKGTILVRSELEDIQLDTTLKNFL